MASQLEEADSCVSRIRPFCIPSGLSHLGPYEQKQDETTLLLFTIDESVNKMVNNLHMMNILFERWMRIKNYLKYNSSEFGRNYK